MAQKKTNQPPRYVALFDILGFKHHIRSSHLGDVVSELGLVEQIVAKDMNDRPLRGMREPKSERGRRLVGRIRQLPKGGWCHSAQYSDSILLYTDGDDGVEFERLLLSCNMLVASLVENGIPVRGAITHGELAADEHRNMYAGKALIDAYELEQAQEWVGAALHESVVRLKYGTDYPALREIGELGRYEVPMKSGDVKHRYCLGWPARLHLTAAQTEDLLSGFGGKREWSGHRKIRETAAFIAHHQKKFPPRKQRFTVTIKN